mmetsp:Transcript_11316/g.22226  ORF Transcript_11316/g.22226 Transcript_11316/m.22226 type:complete len:88 (+) Transcript_11316:857-1120(+)
MSLISYHVIDVISCHQFKQRINHPEKNNSKPRQSSMMNRHQRIDDDRDRRTCVGICFVFVRYLPRFFRINVFIQGHHVVFGVLKIAQ